MNLQASSIWIMSALFAGAFVGGSAVLWELHGVVVFLAYASAAFLRCF